MLYNSRQAIMRSVVLFIVCLSFFMPVSAQQPLMGIDEVKPGMTGIGKTVIQGTAIDNFDVEVLSILKQKGPTGDKILVKVSGDVIDKSGGIAAGMSGSPVYIDGKLIGAIAYGWSMTDRRIGMVTPIYEMLKMDKLTDEGMESPADKADPASGPVPLSTPLMVSGLGQRALDKLTDQLKPYNLAPVLSGTVSDASNIKVELEPGSAMGVQLMRGDIDMTAVGTITYRDGDKILAFGHPFLKRGNVGYFLTTAYIHRTIPSLDNSFKLGAALELAGTIGQDRGDGIMGTIGRYPHNIPLRVHVKDLDTKRENDLFVQVIQDELLSPALVTTAAMQAIEQTIDRTGLGTSWVKMEIMGRNLPGDTLVRENMYFHPADIGAGSLGELLEGLAIILNNSFNSVEIIDVKLDIAIEQAIRIARIEQVQTKKLTVKPGDTIPICVTLKPFRGDPIQQMVNFTVPEHQAPGAMTVMVRGGGIITPVQKLLAQLGSQDAAQSAEPKSLAEFLENFTQRDRNNELVAELLPFTLTNDPAMLLGGEIPAGEYNNKAAAAAPQKNQPSGGVPAEKPPTAKVLTDYIIDGSASLSVQVEGLPAVKPTQGIKSPLTH